MNEGVKRNERAVSSFFLLLISLLMVSCSKYYINTISSVNIKKDELSGAFKQENDSLIISYSFHGQNAPVNIMVENKTDKPLYVDWSRSALILGDKAVSYQGNKVSINGNLSGYSYKWDKDFSTANGAFTAVAKLPEGVGFIPPHSTIDKVVLYLTDTPFKLLADSAYREKEWVYPENGPILLKAATFDESNSPLRFRSYLTLYTSDGNSIKPSAYEHQFFVSRSMKGNLNPQKIPDYQTRRPDLFYTSKRTAYGKTMTGVGIATVLVGIAALDAAVDDGNRHHRYK